MTSVVVVDDHAVVRAGLRLLLEAQDDIEVVGEAGNAKDAIFRARALKPDVILLDVVMPGEDGMTLAREIRAKSDVGIIMLTGRDDVLDRTKKKRRK